MGRFLKKWMGAWLGGRDGSTAIEFSLLAIPFLMLTLGIIESSLMFTSASMLESATSATSRLVRTGQIQQASSDPNAQADMFRQALCNNAVVFVDCDNIAMEVVNMGSFGDYDSFPAQFDEDGNMTPRNFDAGGARDVIMIRTSFRYRMMTPLVGPLLSGPDGSVLFMSTVVLQTEPYEFTRGES